MSSLASPSAISYAAALAFPLLPTPSPMLCGTLLEARFNLAAKVSLTRWKPRNHHPDQPVELQGASVDVELVKIVLTRSFHETALHPRALGCISVYGDVAVDRDRSAVTAAVTVTVGVTVSRVRARRHARARRRGCYRPFRYPVAARNDFNLNGLPSLPSTTSRPWNGLGTAGRSLALPVAPRWPLRR